MTEAQRQKLEETEKIRRRFVIGWAVDGQVLSSRDFLISLIKEQEKEIADWKEEATVEKQNSQMFALAVIEKTADLLAIKADLFQARERIGELKAELAECRQGKYDLSRYSAAGDTELALRKIDLDQARERIRELENDLARSAGMTVIDKEAEV